VVFGAFEAGMPLLGMAIGRSLSSDLGSCAHWLGGWLLVAVGLYQVFGWLRERAAAENRAGDQYGTWGTGRLLISGLALSIDNLVVGFGLGTYHLSVEVAALVIGTVSVAMSLAGLELGARIGPALGERGELASGIVLVGVGITMAASVL
jgi:putative Mn2+ efflux pump MntP